jgi:hypothetical protein
MGLRWPFSPFKMLKSVSGGVRISLALFFFFVIVALRLDINTTFIVLLCRKIKNCRPFIFVSGLFQILVRVGHLDWGIWYFLIN